METAREIQRIDRFQIVARLASGGMGTVYLARVAGLGGFQRLFAVKLIHEHLATEAAFVDMFLDEARLAARIHHPHVVPILEVGTSEGRHFLVMDYVEGTTVAHLRSEALPSVDVAIRITLDALAGLHAAHELKDDHNQLLGLVHRDVSPHNILVGADGLSRLTDFGIARAEARLHHTEGNQVKGKLSYMAPEQVMGGDLDRRVDIFAMGIVLWELLAGKRLFGEDNSVNPLYRIACEPIPALQVPGLPAEISRIVGRALERDRNVRFATAEEFAVALEDAATRAGVLGTHRRVATHLEASFGGKLAQRRDHVRALATVTPQMGVIVELASQKELAPSPTTMSAVSAAGVAFPSYPPPPPEPPAPIRPEEKRSFSSFAWIAAMIALTGITIGGAALYRAMHRAGATPAAPPPIIASAAPSNESIDGASSPSSASAPSAVVPATSASVAKAATDGGRGPSHVAVPAKPTHPAAPSSKPHGSDFGDRL